MYNQAQPCQKQYQKNVVHERQAINQCLPSSPINQDSKSEKQNHLQNGKYMQSGRVEIKPFCHVSGGIS